MVIFGNLAFYCVLYAGRFVGGKSFLVANSTRNFLGVEIHSTFSDAYGVFGLVKFLVAKPRFFIRIVRRFDAL